MDESSLLQKRNAIKLTATLSVLAGAGFVGDPNIMLTDGPGLLTGACLLITAFCIGYLAYNKA